MDARIAAALAALLTAGCIGADGQPAGNESPENPPVAEADRASAGPGASAPSVGDAPWVEFVTFNGTLPLSIYGTIEPGLLDPKSYEEFEVGPSATRIVARLTWTSAGNASDLDAVLVSPEWDCYDATDTVDAAACIFTSVTTRQPKDGWFQNTNGNPGAPDQPSVLTLDRETLDRYGCPGESCRWTAIAYSNGVVVDAAYEYRIQIQYGAPESRDACPEDASGGAVLKCE